MAIFNSYANTTTLDMKHHLDHEHNHFHATLKYPLVHLTTHINKLNIVYLLDCKYFTTITSKEEEQ